MIVHHQNVWHGSGPNISNTRHRRALVIHLLNGNVKWNISNERRPYYPNYIYGRYYIRNESIPREDFFPYTYHKKTTETTQEEEAPTKTTDQDADATSFDN